MRQCSSNTRWPSLFSSTSLSALSALSVEPCRKVEGVTGIPNPENWSGCLGRVSAGVRKVVRYVGVKYTLLVQNLIPA